MSEVGFLRRPSTPARAFRQDRDDTCERCFDDNFTVLIGEDRLGFGVVAVINVAAVKLAPFRNSERASATAA